MKIFAATRLMNNLAIRVDGNKHIGLGHIFRCLNFADFVKDQGNVVHFYMLESSLNPVVRRFLDQKGFPWIVVSPDHDPWQEDFSVLLHYLNRNHHDSILVDLIIPDQGDDDLNQNQEFRPMDAEMELQQLSGLGIPVFAISDQFDKVCLEADIIINTCPCQQVEWYSDDLQTRYLLGPEYYILAQPFKRFCDIPRTFTRAIPKIVTFCGGNDHRGFTEIILNSLQPIREDITLEVIVGAATPNGEQIAERLNSQGITAYFGIDDVAPVLFDADFAVSTSGNTLFDLAALGTPFAAVSTRERQRQTARFFQSTGNGVDLGRDPKEIISGLREAARTIIFNKEKLAEMSRRGRKLVDGSGAERIMAVMNAVIHNRPRN